MHGLMVTTYKQSQFSSVNFFLTCLATKFLYFLDVSTSVHCSHWLGVDVPDEDDLCLEAGVHGAPGLGPGRQHQQPVGLRHAALPARHLHTRRLGHAHRLAPPEPQPHPGDYSFKRRFAKISQSRRRPLLGTWYWLKAATTAFTFKAQL